MGLGEEPVLPDGQARCDRGEMPTRLVHLVVDAADPPTLARFWSAALEWPITVEEPDEMVIEPPEHDPAPEGQLPLVFVPVAEPKTTKNRIHLDLASSSADHQAALVSRLEGLGARQIDIGQRDVSWVVMADPEGNELCVVSHHGSVGKDPASPFAGIRPVAAVVFDCDHPEAIAPFWAAATGWAVLGQDDNGVWLRDVTTGGPYLDLHRVAERKTVKLRVHIDVAPFADDDHTAEVERLRAIGAREIDIGRADARWVVLADPQGNELCVLTPR
jgi:predicted enzyme related to lactoylglutathione lyase